MNTTPFIEQLETLYRDVKQTVNESPRYLGFTAVPYLKPIPGGYLCPYEANLLGSMIRSNTHATTTPVYGHFVHGLGLAVVSSVDFATCRPLSKGKIGILLSNMAPPKETPTSTGIAKPLGQAFDTLSSFDFDSDGKVVSQPDPAAYHEALMAVRSALLSAGKGVK